MDTKRIDELYERAFERGRIVGRLEVQNEELMKLLMNEKQTEILKEAESQSVCKECANPVVPDGDKDTRVCGNCAR